MVAALTTPLKFPNPVVGFTQVRRNIFIHLYICIYIYITVSESLRPTKVPRRQEDQ